MNVRRRLVILTTFYWFLLAYIMAALVWWFISLEQQNNEMANLKLAEIAPGDPFYSGKQAEVFRYKERKHAQYVGEGLIFMLLILLGAVFVYRVGRRYLLLGRQQQNFMMAVTHELKTPLAVAKLNIETLVRRSLTEEQQERLLTQALVETDRLNDLCNNILVASRFDAGSMGGYKELVALDELVLEAADQFEGRFPERIFETYTADKGWVMGEPVLLKMLLSNLLENACKYSPRNAPVVISLHTTDSIATVAIADQGQGIPDSEKGRIFDKFYRMGDEQSRSAKGTGLGLYLCRKIMEDHKGKIEVADNHPQGTIFTATFKKADPLANKKQPPSL